VAERFDERIDPWFHRLVKHALWRGAPDAPISVHDFDLFDAEKMAVVGRKVIEEAGRMGNCVVGGPRRAMHPARLAGGLSRVSVRAHRDPQEARGGAAGSVPNLEAVIREYDRLRAAGVRQIFRPGVVQPESVRSDDQHQTRLRERHGDDIVRGGMKAEVGAH